MLGILGFLCMINDLQTECLAIKYIDDMTIYHTSNVPSDPTLQMSVDTAISWSESNKMRINVSKRKEMLIFYAKEAPNVPNITVDGIPLDRVPQCKLLGIVLSDQLNWNNHIDTIYKKVCSHMWLN